MTQQSHTQAITKLLPVSKAMADLADALAEMPGLPDGLVAHVTKARNHLARAGDLLTYAVVRAQTQPKGETK